jgi:4-hydroxy-tetrahydrodipicolinate synthase
MVALVTPFAGSEFDGEVYRELIEFQIESGIDGIIPCGTTGESATLSHEEHDRVVETAVRAVAGRVPVIAGTGSNSTEESLRLTIKAKDVGADGALLITPYYNRPTQEGHYRHFMTIADKVDLPLVPYNVPSRTGTNLLPETVARLAEHQNIVAIKEATGSMKHASEIRQLCGDTITLISGDDFTYLPLLEIGGEGAISVVANVAPRDMADLYDSFASGDHRKARDLHYRLFPLVTAMFLETSPVPVKTALAMMGKIKEGLRMPLVELTETNRGKLKQVLSDYGLI